MLTYDFFANGITAPRNKNIRIRIVDDENCPSCGNAGSPKVWDADGTCWWKCLSFYNDCKIAYWVPGTGRTEMKLPPAEAARRAEEIRQEVLHSMEGRRWISQGNCSRMIPNDDALPEGWTEGTGNF
jgi:hypothetical protein